MPRSYRRARRPARSGRRKRSASTRTRRRWVNRGLRVFAAILLLTVPTAVVYVVYLDHTVGDRFAGRQWSLPARVYGRPLELHVGQTMSAEQLRSELAWLYYQAQLDAGTPGTFAQAGDTFVLHSRGFHFDDGDESPRKVRLRLAKGRVQALEQEPGGDVVALLRLEPRLIGTIFPRHQQDRLLIELADTPPLLVKALLAVEDRRFYEHRGVAPRAIARALWANLAAGQVVQGGSTLTQQLVKNLYLGPERTWWRKINEAVMALLLERRYSKEAILEVYLNEIYLGQDGKRAIHGFGLGSRFYFGRPLDQLSVAQLAMLVGLVRGPSYYNPRRHPERARARRNLVLQMLAERAVISPAQAERAKQAALGVVAQPPGGASPYPDFLDLVRRQLKRDYDSQDLSSDGLRIFATLDPWAQDIANRVVRERTAAFERHRGLPRGTLEGAAVITRRATGEVLATVGGRGSRRGGFNRALDAVRPIGSLVKPAVYLTALSRPHRYTLVTRLEDRPVRLRDGRGAVWSPENFDRRAHGRVMLINALAHSYNLSTVRLGLDVGVDAVAKTLHALGVRRAIEPYPSLLLGALALTPVETAQLYQTIADGGFHTPLRAIRSVLDAHGRALERYPLVVHAAADPAAVYLLGRALQRAVREGTGRGLAHHLSFSLRVAGKTGTTDGLRDSWFAGFTEGHVAVVWLGADDNRSTGLTGASGALQVWGEMMQRIGVQPLELVPPEAVIWASVDSQSGLRAGGDCRSAVTYPFIAGSAPQRLAPCARRGSASGHGTDERTMAGEDLW